jgi:amino acid adenylation domain-containing protein
MDENNTGFWLSPQQKAIWTLQQRNPAAPSRACVLLASDRFIPSDALRASLVQVVERHDILRTIFRRQPGMKVPFQVVAAPAEFSWEELDLSSMAEHEQASAMDRLLREEQQRNLPLDQSPVLRATLIRWQKGSALLLSLPAMCADVYSLLRLASELSLPRPESTEDSLRYVQYAQWQNDTLKSEDEPALNARSFWQKQYSTACLPDLPSETRAPDGVGFSPEMLAVPLGSDCAGKLDEIASRLGTSTANVLLAVLQTLLSRSTGQVQFLVAVDFDGREYEELTDVMGSILKSLPVEARFDADYSFREVVAHVAQSRQAAGDWQEYFDCAAEPEPQLLAGFAYVEAPRTTDFRVVRFDVVSSQYRLKLQCVRDEKGLRAEFHYDRSRFDRANIERLGEQFRVLLEAAVSNPDTPVSRLPLLSEGERHRLLFEWNRTEAAYPQDRCWHELFEQQAGLTPQRIAVRCGEQALSYTELNGQANQLAHHLRRLGVGPDSLVGLCLERSLSMMVAVLAIAKAGGAYVPLNPDTPKSRLLQQLAGAKVLISEESNLARLPDFSGPVLAIDYPTPPWASESTSNPQPLTTPDNLVYVIYTSGSTGVPKGVAVTHRNLVNYACFITQRLALSNHPDGLQFATVSTLAADLGNTSIYPALISGGSLHVIPYEVSTDSQRLARYFAAHPVDVLKIVPSHLQALLQGPEAAQILPRRYLITGGEALTRSLLEKILQLGGTCRVINHYGPTETTVGSLTLAIDDYAWQSSSTATIPLGRPIANTQTYILDAHGEPVPVGVVGELYIAGAGVTRGYLNQPERTAERFLPNRFVNQAGARMYRTGDLARYLPDGNIEFLGRADDQVKVRGFRIELGEIEAVLGAHPDIKQAVVLARENPLGDKQLLAYVVAHRDRPLSVPQVQAYLREQLPDYMVPSALMVLDKLPLTANGKIDRQALPQPDDIHTHSKAYVAPGTPTEEVIANIWAEVLRRDRISRDDNFFDLGGHSLLATQVISRVRDHFRTEVALRALFEAPTLSGFAAAVDQSHATSESTIVPLSRDRYRTAGPVR